mgnify:FL=1
MNNYRKLIFSFPSQGRGQGWGPSSFIPRSSLLAPRSSITSLILLAFAVTSCGDSEFEYSNHRAHFTYDNSIHLDATLASAMNPMSPGIFCRISRSSDSYFDFENNQNMSSRVAINAVEKQRICELGTYNASGIIIGYGTLDNPPIFYAYDAQCPNCYEESNMPRYQLTMSTDGKASCRNCQRQYDMNNGGIVVNGANGDKLIRYRASTTGPMGILNINN